MSLPEEAVWTHGEISEKCVLRGKDHEEQWEGVNTKQIETSEQN